MWAIDNQTAYAAERNWVRDKNGEHHWVVAVRASFAIRSDGVLERDKRQDPPLLIPEYYGEPGTSSLRQDSDLLAIKPGTDIVLDGHAHAPYLRPAERVVVSIRIGELRKTLVVHGDRRFRRHVAGGLGMTGAEPFLSKPIRFERAYGGYDQRDSEPRNHRLDPRNPVGCGFAMRNEHLADQPVPTIQYPDGDIAMRGPAGFGAIDPGWSPRRELAGTYDARWAQSKKPLLADDYDERFALSAPQDQQVIPSLRGGEPVELTNLSASGTLVFPVPRHYFTFATRFGSRIEEHRARLTGLFIEPEILRVSAVWQSVLAVSPADLEYLDETTVDEKEYIR